MLLVISDANVLIDCEDGNLISVIFLLPYEIAVPDVLFETELLEKHGELLKAGLKVKTLTAKSIEKMVALKTKHPRPSTMDCFALALAIQEECYLLTGDKDLRIAAKDEGIEVHGTLWLVEELLKTNIVDLKRARKSFDAMMACGSRLPWNEVEKLLNRYEEVEVAEVGAYPIQSSLISEVSIHLPVKSQENSSSFKMVGNEEK